MAVTDRYTNYQKRKEAAGIVNPEEERQIHDESVARQAEEILQECPGGGTAEKEYGA